MASREQEILDAARKLFREKGYYATTMQDIADAVGLQKASLYHYIRSKEALLLKIAGETMRLFHAELDRIEAAGGAQPISWRRPSAPTCGSWPSTRRR